MTTFRPDTAAEVQDVVAWAVSEEAPLEVVSRASKRAAGDWYSETLFSPRTRRLISLLSLFD